MVKLDAAILDWVVAHRIAWLDRPILLLSIAAAQGALWMVVGVVLAAVGRLSVRNLLRLVLTILIALVLADNVIKPIVHRGRPFTGSPDITVIGVRPRNASFPSGHAASSFGAAMVLARVVPQARVAWWTLAALVALSRIYLGVHYPIDVTAGALLGVACALLVLRAVPDLRA